MTSLEAFAGLSTILLGDFSAKPTSLEADQQEASTILWASPEGGTTIGIWECTPGRFTADRTKAGEYCHILSGRASVCNADGSGMRTVAAGDLLVLPQGWTGEWTIHEHVRKLFLISER